MTNDNKGGSSSFTEDDPFMFFGEITASVTHELNNILSVIDQSAGLVEDFLASPDGDVMLTEEKLIQISDKIRKNSRRGIDIIKHLNSFAHSTDHPDAAFGANDMLENWGALTRRFVNLKAATMEIRLSEQPVQIQANAYLVRKILYEALKNILSYVKKDDKIIISVYSDNTDAVIIMEGLLANMPTDTDITYIEKLTTSAGGSVNNVTDNSKIGFEFRFPVFV